MFSVQQYRYPTHSRVYLERTLLGSRNLSFSVKFKIGNRRDWNIYCSSEAQHANTVIEESLPLSYLQEIWAPVRTFLSWAQWSPAEYWSYRWWRHIVFPTEPRIPHPLPKPTNGQGRWQIRHHYISPPCEDHSKRRIKATGIMVAAWSTRKKLTLFLTRFKYILRVWLTAVVGMVIQNITAGSPRSAAIPWWSLAMSFPLSLIHYSTLTEL